MSILHPEHFALNNYMEPISATASLREKQGQLEAPQAAERTFKDDHHQKIIPDDGLSEMWLVA